MNILNSLIDLANDLDKKGYSKDADLIDNLIKSGVAGLGLSKYEKPGQPVSTEGLHILLDLIGLVPGVGEAADLTNAALYLADGPSDPKNLLFAALSITSMVSGLGDAAKIIKYGGKLAPDALASIAKMILENLDTIKTVFSNLKSSSATTLLAKNVKGGSLLAKHSDTMIKSLQDWAKNIVDSYAKSQIQEEVKAS